MWNMKNTMLFVASLVVVILVSMSMANASETKKTKAEWNALYAEAGCMDLNFFEREICKTKVFQKTNWQSGKEQLNNTLKKIGVN
tara:strand:+ start:204 stop:458 length:255 start_codon:yes stop_codon:yes gene_type:complete